MPDSYGGALVCRRRHCKLKIAREHRLSITGSARGEQTVWLGASPRMRRRTRDEAARALWWLNMISCDDAPARGRARMKGEELDTFYQCFVCIATNSSHFAVPPSFHILTCG